MSAPADVKANGIHYTPPELATFLARQALDALEGDGPFRVLDPACGDGALLEAIARESDNPERLTLMGMDTDSRAIAAASTRLRYLKNHVHDVELRKYDFLEAVADQLEPSLLNAEAVLELGEMDVVITNPPYVRTQVLGASRAQALAVTYGLRGRVDLYHAFVIASSATLRDRGILALLSSNRYLSTKGGESVRRFIAGNYSLVNLVDLGDTKLFAAAVLPAILIARRDPATSAESIDPCPYTRIYERRGSVESTPTDSGTHVLSAVASDHVGLLSVDNVTYEIERGQLDPSRPSQPWNLSNHKTVDFLSAIETHACAKFGDRLKIRVGIKTTADAVFIRNDWGSLPDELQPEPDILLPLIQREGTSRWRTSSASSAWRVLYPYDLRRSRRHPVDLDDYPRARDYLLQHRERLEGRRYVIDAGRKWYEIWVPQRPADWARRKLVFPDISETAAFSTDESGAVVNGTCYWALAPEDDELLRVMLGVANSATGQQYYDAVCGNRLYAGRRRYMTQYVKEFPIPAETEASRQLSKCVGELMQADITPSDASRLEAEVDTWVARSFGLPE